MKNELTIVIPCKNEEKYIGKLLNSLSNQKEIQGVQIIISDANSTDRTKEIIKSFKNLKIKIIKGGLPSVGRNNGLNLSKTPFTLFIDADAEIYDSDLIYESVKAIKSSNSQLLACKLNSKLLPVKILYKLNNIALRLSKLDKPFAVGIFMMIDTKVAKKIGGFPEDAMHCEDYLLSSQISKDKFIIINKYVFSDDRRFKKMSYWNMVKYFIKNIKMRNNKEYFKKDINYWS